jgi:hypothetical protein
VSPQEALQAGEMPHRALPGRGLSAEEPDLGLQMAIAASKREAREAQARPTLVDMGSVLPGPGVSEELREAAMREEGVDIVVENFGEAWDAEFDAIEGQLERAPREGASEATESEKGSGEARQPERLREIRILGSEQERGTKALGASQGSAESITIDGVTMSEDDAVELALRLSMAGSDS